MIKSTPNSSFKKTFSQLSVFLFAFIFLVVLHISFNYFIDKTNKKNLQEQTRLSIGSLIVKKLLVIESELYRLAPTTGEKAQVFIHQNIQANLQLIKEYLTVLQHGGEITEIIKLNIDSHEQMENKIFYQAPENNTTFTIAVIELSPALIDIDEKASLLLKYIKKRGFERESGNVTEWAQTIKTIKSFMRTMPPFFTRILENANRMVFQSSQRLDKLEKQILKQQQLYNRIEIVIVCFIILTILIIAYIFARQFDKSTRQLQEALLLAKNTQKSQQQSLEFIKHVTDSMGEGVYAQDKDGHCIFLNKKAENLLEWTQKELETQSIHNTIHQHDCDGNLVTENNCPIFQSISKGSIYQSENDMFMRKNGDLFPVSIISEPMVVNNEIIGSVAVFQDITQRKKEEKQLKLAKYEAEQANLMKSEFLSNMSHELRTPMNAIIGLSHVLNDYIHEPEAKGYIRRILSASDTLLELINNVLDLSKIESGKMELENIDFSLPELLLKLFHLTANRAHQKSIKIYYLMEPDVPSHIISDPLRLNQVLINLVSNAIKFTDKGNITITITLNSKEGNKLNLLFKIQDTGIGMTTKQQEYIFKAFSQADGSTTRNYGGTGLGLSISKQIVEMMGGRFDVESVPERGTTFSFTINCETDQSNENLLSQYKQNLAKHQIIMFEADTILQDYFKSLFNQLGAEYKLIDNNVNFSNWLTDNILNKNCDTSVSSKENVIILNEQLWLKHLNELILNANNPQLQEFVFIIILDSENTIQSHSQVSNIELKHEFISNPFTPIEILDALSSNKSYSIKENSVNDSAEKNNEVKYLQFNANILIVEDNRVNQLVAAKLLKRHGLTVTIVNNGQEALDKLSAKNQFDLIFMDIQMPVLDGIETTKKIRGQEQFKNLPIIALTAHAIREEVQNFLAVGMNAHLSKPLIPDVLLKVLKKWLSKKIS